MTPSHAPNPRPRSCPPVKSVKSVKSINTHESIKAVKAPESAHPPIASRAFEIDFEYVGDRADASATELEGGADDDAEPAPMPVGAAGAAGVASVSVDGKSQEHVDSHDSQSALSAQDPLGAQGALGAQDPVGTQDALGAQDAVGTQDALGAQDAQNAQDPLGVQGALDDTQGALDTQGAQLPDVLGVQHVQESQDADALIAWLRERFERVLTEAGVVACTLSVAIVGDPTMADLHAQYLDDPTTTDVLTFDFLESENRNADPARPPVELEGEIVICRDEAARQAVVHHHAERDELLLYLVHGLLHLQGHDDHDQADALRMHQREDELLTAIGMPPVYASPRNNRSATSPTQAAGRAAPRSEARP